MAVHATSIAAGKCFTVTGQSTKIRRVVRLEQGQVTYQERNTMARARWGASVSALGSAFAAEVEREVHSDFDPAS